VIAGYALGLLVTLLLTKSQLAYYGKLVDRLVVVIFTPLLLFIALDLFFSLLKESKREQIFFLLELVVALFYYYIGLMRWIENTPINKLTLEEIISLGNILGFLFSFCTLLLWIFLSRFAGEKVKENEV
jgi:hypothetical protein